MQAPAIGKSLAEGQSFNHLANGLHKFSHTNKIDDDGSTSAGSSDRENERSQQLKAGVFETALHRSGHSKIETTPGGLALLCLMDILTVTQEPIRPSKTRAPKAMRKMQRMQRKERKPKPSPPPGFDAFAPPPGLQQTKKMVVPMGFTPPPGLPSPSSISLPPGLDHGPIKITKPTDYDPKAFHRELVAIFRELSQSTNVAAAVRRVRSQSVPRWHQAAETTDILTRAAEECRGTHRRLFFAFAAGLAKGDPSAFESLEVMSGVQAFFRDVFEDLCEEVPRLPNIVEAELIPTLRAVFPAEILNPSLPARFRVA